MQLVVLQQLKPRETMLVLIYVSQTTLKLPFAAKILEALRNYGGNDKIITLPELMVYLEKINPEPRTGSFGDDEPGSDFVFVAK